MDFTFTCEPYGKDIGEWSRALCILTCELDGVSGQFHAASAVY